MYTKCPECNGPVSENWGTRKELVKGWFFHHWVGYYVWFQLCEDCDWQGEDKQFE